MGNKEESLRVEQETIVTEVTVSSLYVCVSKSNKIVFYLFSKYINHIIFLN